VTINSSLLTGSQKEGDAPSVVGDPVQDAPDQKTTGGAEVGVQVPPDKRPADVISGVVDSLIDTMPDVQPHAIEQAADEQAGQKSKWADLTDKKGRPFDPAIHRTRRDGSPITTPKGRLYIVNEPDTSTSGTKKRPSRPKNTSYVAGTDRPETVNQGTAKSRAAGASTAAALIALGIGLGGDEWAPVTNADTGLDERAALETAFADYFEHKNWEDIPPGVALVIAVGCYAIPRFNRPKTRTRLSNVKNWIKRKIADRKLKKHGLKTTAESSESATDRAA